MTDRSTPPGPPTPSPYAVPPASGETGLPTGSVGAAEQTGPIEEALTAIPEPPPTLGRARGHRVRARTGAWPAGGTPRVDPSSLESVADDVAFWIEATAQDVSRAMMDGMYAPFSARLGQEETARYYGSTLFTPDGQLDPQQWWAEYARIGPDGLAKAINGGAAWRRRMGLRVSLPVSKFQETGVGPSSGGTVGVTPAGGWPGNTPPGEPGPDGPLPESDQMRPAR
jgi:hypothetical protein